MKKCLEKLKHYLNMENYTIPYKSAHENVKEMCVTKLCYVLGIGCDFNYQCEFFQIFASIVGEAVCETLNIQTHFVKDDLRLIKYDGINFVEKSKRILEIEEVDEAILDIYNFLDKNKQILLKKFSEG